MFNLMNRSTMIIKCQTEYIFGVQQSLNRNCESEGNLHLLTLGFHVIQNKFVTRISLIFHKCSTMPAITAEWPMYMGLIKKLPLVSYIVVLLILLYLHTCTNTTFWLDSKSWTRDLSKGIPVSRNILRKTISIMEDFSGFW